MTRDPHRFPVLIDAETDNRASDAFHAAKRRAGGLRYLTLILALVALMVGGALIAMLAGKAAANVHITILETKP